MGEQKDEFTEKHLTWIRLREALIGSKDLYVSCFCSDNGAINLPNSNRWIKKLDHKHVASFIEFEKQIHAKEKDIL